MADLGPATFRPPYNHLSRFQNSGLVNPNTIFDRTIWEGISKGDPSYDPSIIPSGLTMYDRFLQSRRGYAGNPLELNSDYPTLFANPFRSADSADLMPNVPGRPSPSACARTRRFKPRCCVRIFSIAVLTRCLSPTPA